MLTTRWPNVLAPQARLGGDRLSKAWGDLLSRVRWEQLVTLTFDPARRFPVGQAIANREALRWCRLVEYALARPVGWAYATERGRTGQWHVHVLLVGIGDRRLPVGLWQQRNGHTDVRPVYDPRGVSLYTSKQAASGGEVVLSDTLNRYTRRLRTTAGVSLSP